jgi:predicted GH43/DUF377 family glycosyl hydrolase
MTPSIKDQTPWNVGFFDFGKAQTPDTRFFNPALIQINGDDWLIARRAAPIPWHHLGQNSLVAFRLNKEHKPEAFVEINLKNRNYKDQHWEDPRITSINGRMVLSYCTFQIYRNATYSGAHQQVAFLNEGFQPMETWDPIYGGNGGSILMQSGNEKNWIFFEHDGQMMMIYNTEPHQVIKWDNQQVVEKWETPGFGWKWGHMRGGSPPIRVGDEYICFFHSSTKWTEKKRQYHMGAYVFEAKPPFKMKRMTRKPLLSGSQKDPWIEGLPLVVFPCGSILDGKKYVVSMGINDYTSAWIEIPVKDLDSLMK